MRLIGLAALLLFLRPPAYAGRDDGEPRLTLDIPSPEARPIQPLPDTILPLKEKRAPLPAVDDPFKRDLVVLRARAWLTTGSVDTRISKQIISGPDVSAGETEQRGANGLMLVYSAEVAPIRWLSGEFQYGKDNQDGTYCDHYWLDAPGVAIQFPNVTWYSPHHQDDLVLGSDVRSRRDWTAGTVYARVLDLRNLRPTDPVWHETLDFAFGYERFRQNSQLTNLSVAMNQGNYFSPGLPLGSIPGFDSSYDAAWSGPHFGFRDEIAVPCGFSFDGLLLWSPFMVYRGEGYDNLGTYWLPTGNSSPNFVDAAHGTAVHLQFGARWDWSMFRVEAGYQRFYFYSRTGTRTFFEPDGSTSSMQLDFATAEIAGAYAGVTWRY
jgi:hypothetical protein